VLARRLTTTWLPVRGRRLLDRRACAQIGRMRRTSLANARARLSAPVDDAEYGRRKTLILRRGKPSAAIVPVDVAMPARREPRRPSARDIKSLFDALAAGGRRGAVADLLAGRR
jgi:antitoxin (DNA-binding transcriptional repressor) of toxin-antitoxin stability system